jgi:tRNA (mo5U34)-methyltransferase
MSSDELSKEWQSLFAALADSPAAAWLDTLPAQLDGIRTRHGDWPKWQTALDALPDTGPELRRFDCDRVTLGRADELDAAALAELEASLRQLHPWRKGPFEIHGIHIDTEWRSDWKWQRLAPHIAPLAGRRVLDIGCGNGYHLWRMLGAGAELAIGLDPTLLFLAQFRAVRHFAGADLPVHLIPLGIEAMPVGLAAFDTVFSMGVLYHRRSPIDHLIELREALRPGGELVLETLVVEGDAERVLVPEGRYARMRNVWFIPSVAAALRWLRRAGFAHVRCVDQCPTTTEEQRSTDWMRFESLERTLDENDPNLTVEGLPAPRRAILIAERPHG